MCSHTADVSRVNILSLYFLIILIIDLFVSKTCLVYFDSIVIRHTLNNLTSELYVTENKNRTTLNE